MLQSISLALALVATGAAASGSFRDQTTVPCTAWGCKEVPMFSDGPLVECQVSRLGWKLSDLPVDNGRTHHVATSAAWPYGHGRQANLNGQDFVTPMNGTEFLVTYPAGTELTFDLTPWGRHNSAGGNYGGRLVKTVQPGNSTDCIPVDNKPIITKIPDFLRECDTSTFEYSGVAGPLHGYIWGEGLPTGMANIDFKDNGSFSWLVDYPIGTKLHLNVWEEKASGNGERGAYAHVSMVVDTLGGNNWCIPLDHFPSPRHWYKKPGGIAFIVIASIIVGGVVLYFIVRAAMFCYSRRKVGEIRLPTTA